MEDRSKALTSLQKKLLEELKEIAGMARLDYVDILDYDPKERTLRLRLMKDQIVRSEIIADYTLVDEMLGSIICNYFFGKKEGLHKTLENKEIQDLQLLHPGSPQSSGETQAGQSNHQGPQDGCR